MTKLIRLLFLISIILTACNSYEEEPAITPTHRVIIISTTELPPDLISIDCIKLAYTQFDMNQCAAKKAADSQQKLDQLLYELQVEFQNKDQGPSLAHIQQGWEALKEKDCLWQKSFYGNGSIAPMIFSLCQSKYNLERIEELKIFLCEGAGMTGPCAASKKYDEVE